MKERFLIAALFLVGGCSPARAPIEQGELLSHPSPPTQSEITARGFIDAISNGDSELAGSFVAPEQRGQLGFRDQVQSTISNLRGCRIGSVERVNDPVLSQEQEMVGVTFKEPCGVPNMRSKITHILVGLSRTSRGEYFVASVSYALVRA